jgi:hypothetical protein
MTDNKQITYFVEDSTKIDPKTHKPKLVTGYTVPALIKYLEGMCERQFKMTRKDFMIDRSDFIGYSENNDATFYDQMREHFKIGIIKNDRLVETDIIRANIYKNTTEYGN